MSWVRMGLDGLLGVFVALAGGVVGIMSGPGLNPDGGPAVNGGPGLNPDGLV